MANNSRGKKKDLDNAWAEFLKKESGGSGYDDGTGYVDTTSYNQGYVNPNDMYQQEVYQQGTAYQDPTMYYDNSSGYGMDNGYDSSQMYNTSANSYTGMNYENSNVNFDSMTMGYDTENIDFNTGYNINSFDFNQGMQNLGGYADMAANATIDKEKKDVAQEKKTSSKASTQQPKVKEVKVENKANDVNVQEKTEAKPKTSKKKETEKKIDIKTEKLLAQKDEQIQELQDKLMRNIAEFDNFRKRTEKEKALMFEIGAKSIVEKILPVIDNFERGLDAVTPEERETAFVQGIDKIYKHFMATLEEAGVKPIEALGNEFNPDFHNAVMHVEDENFGENIVAEEFQKGYTYRESVVRHSMVKVAN